MRSELENIERIEKYLRNELSIEDMQAFDEQLKTDSTLQSQVEIQKNTVEAIQRLSVKQSIQKAFSTYKMRRNFFRFGLGSLFALAIVSAALWASDSFETENSSAAKMEGTSIPQSENDALLESDFVVSYAFMAEVQSFEIDPTIKTSLKIGKEGTVLHIPKSAFVDQEGKAITSTVTITYQEFKNPADMAFSGIPMTYTNRDVEYNFNSSGMFSIKGYSDGEELKVNPAKALSIDYALAKQNVDIDFYRLKDDSTNWEFLEEIDELTALEHDFTDSLEGENFGITAPTNLSAVAGKTESRIIVSSNDPVNINPAITVTIGPPITEKRIFQYNKDMGIDSVQAQKNVDKYIESTAGHTYPPIISGLRINSFGVYNCDAIYRLRNRVTVQPTYLDENGNEIKEQKMVSLIDLSVNSAFSFGPRSFTCNRKANNLILLFTNSNELYLLEKGNFGKSPIANNGSSNYQMKNVTETITNSNDLKAYLVP
jgi:hypothetical protein